MNERETVELLMKLSVDHPYLRPPSDDPRAAQAMLEAWQSVTGAPWATLRLGLRAALKWRTRPAAQLERYPVLRPDVFRMYLNEARRDMEREENRRDALEISRRAELGDTRPALDPARRPRVPLRQRAPEVFARHVTEGRARAAFERTLAQALREGQPRPEAERLAKAAHDRILTEQEPTP